MTEEQLYDYSEVLADIAYEVGSCRLRMDGNSRTAIDTIINWAQEFQKRHKDTDWEEVEYLDTIYAFIEEKLGLHLYDINCKCSNCSSNSLRYEIVEEVNYDPEYRVICRSCGRILEGEPAKEFLLDILFDIYWEILWKSGEAEYDIEPYLKERLHISKGVLKEEDLLHDYKEWKEQSDLAFEKVQDANYYSQL